MKVNAVERYYEKVTTNNLQNTFSYGDLVNMVQKCDIKKKVHFISYDKDCGIKEACMTYSILFQDRFPDYNVSYKSVSEIDFSCNIAVLSLVPDHHCMNIICKLKQYNIFVIGIFVWELSSIYSEMFIQTLQLFDKVVVPSWNNHYVLQKYLINSSVCYHGIVNNQKITKKNPNK